jgi:flagellin-like protein
MKKGISPIIASVLLIALVIATAGIYSGWFTNFIKTITSTIGPTEEKRITCTYGGISLSHLEFNTSYHNLTGEIDNTDIIILGNIDLEIFYDNATREEKDLNKVLEPGEKDVFNVLIDANYQKVRVITNCSNVYDEVTEGYISQF